MRILIATGIYPPEVGGPAQYAINLKTVWKSKGYKVKTAVFSRFIFLPTGIRHLAYMFFSVLPKIITADFVLILDTFSSALPTVFLGKLLGKKMILRTGGDFLWEQYVERTGDMVLLKDFYQDKKYEFSKKEKDIFRLTKYVLKNVSSIIWSTEWQKDIFLVPYGLQNQKHFIVENYYGEKKESNSSLQKNFIGATRNLKWKNLDRVKKIFEDSEIKNLNAVLDLSIEEHSLFQEKIKNCYAVILVSLGDISPNMILDAISYNKPFILTKETGIYERVEDIALFVDPMNENEIREKILWLCNEENYNEQRNKLTSFDFKHTWEQIADEYEDIYKKIK